MVRSLFLESCLSLSIIFFKVRSYLELFKFSCLTLLKTLASILASVKIFISAFGTITVPISLPSITEPFPPGRIVSEIPLMSYERIPDIF